MIVMPEENFSADQRRGASHVPRLVLYCRAGTGMQSHEQDSFHVRVDRGGGARAGRDNKERLGARAIRGTGSDVLWRALCFTTLAVAPAKLPLLLSP